MSRIVKMPDGAMVRFDDDFTREEIRALITAKYPDFAAQQEQATAAPSAAPNPMANYIQEHGLPGQGHLAFADKAIESIPIVGRPIKEGLEGFRGMLAETLGIGTREDADAFSAAAVKGAPAEAMAGEVFGNVAPLSVAGAMPLAGRALGMTGSLASRALAGGISGGAIAGADTYVDTGGDADAAWGDMQLGLGLGAGLPLAGKAVSSIAGGVKNFLSPKIIGPALDELQTAKTAAYRAADQAGVVYTPKSYTQFVDDVATSATADNLSPTRHPKAYSFIQDLSVRHPNGLSLTELDQLRQEVRRDLLAGSDGGEKHFGQMIINKIDEFIEGANQNDMIAGSANQGADLITNARELNKRFRKAELIENALDSAELRTAATGSGGNINNAIRQRLAALIDPKSRTFKSFTADEREAIRSVVDQGRVEGLLRLIGKLSPSGNGLMAAGSIVSTAANPMFAAAPLAGMAAKGAADGITRNRANVLRALIAQGGQMPKTSKGMQSVMDALMQANRTPVNMPWAQASVPMLAGF